MSETRMAGDKLEEGRRKSQLQQRLGDEEFERIGAKGYQDQRKGDKYSAAEVKSELRSGQYGDTVDERVDHFRKLQEDGTKFNSKAQQFLSSKYGFEFGKKDKPEEPESPMPELPDPPDGKPAPKPAPITGGPGNTQGVNQDNDVSIKGDGNTVNQDNSVTQTIDNSTNYGDDLRYFNYEGWRQGKGGANYDTPASMATMAGYYDVNDSASKTHEFLGKYIQGNNLAQKGMRDSYNARTDTDYKAQAASVNQFNPQAMQERIDREPLINRSRSTVDFAKLFGDVDNMNFGWTPTAAPKPINSDVADIADEYKDELD